MIRRNRLILAINATCVAVATLGFNWRIAAAEEPSITPIAGDKLPVVVTAITPEGQLQGTGLEKRLGIDEVLQIHTGRDVGSSSSSPYLIRMIGGGRLYGSKIEMDGERFKVTTTFGQRQLPAEAVKAIVFQPDADQDLVLKTLADPSTDVDRIIAVTSIGQQSLSGLLERITPEKVFLNYKNQSRSISIEKIVAVVVADLRISPPRSTLVSAQLTDGSKIIGSCHQLADGKLAIGLVPGEKLEIPWSSVARVDVQSKNVQYLSDRQPIEVEQSSIATTSFPWQADRSVDGNPLSIKQVSTGEVLSFSKGLGTHAYCRLVFANDEDFDRFSATVGIDAETEGRGDCQVSVTADGIELWSGRVQATEDPVEVNVSIKGMKQVTLVVQPGAHLDLGDHVDWANARFLKIANE